MYTFFFEQPRRRTGISAFGRFANSETLDQPATACPYRLVRDFALRNNAYSNILKILPPKKKKKKKRENFQIKHSDIFHISAQNIDCGSSLEPNTIHYENTYSNIY